MFLFLKIYIAYFSFDHCNSYHSRHEGWGMRERTITLSIHTPPHKLQRLQKGFGYFAAGIWSCSLAPSLWDAAAFEVTAKCFLITVEVGRGVSPTSQAQWGEERGSGHLPLGSQGKHLGLGSELLAPTKLPPQPLPGNSFPVEGFFPGSLLFLF